MTAAAPAALVLAAEAVDYARAGRQILRQVSLAARPGEVLAVTGPSGSGKSSLLALLAGLEVPDHGRITLGGRPLTRTGDVRRTYGIVLQAYGLVSVLTASENVELVLQARGLPREQVRERAHGALTDVDLAAVADHLLEKLSGGQQQRVAVARALVTRPSYLLADEPTAELDHNSRQVVLDHLFAAAGRGAVVVIATHDRAVAERCHRELRLADGQVVGEGANRPAEAVMPGTRTAGGSTRMRLPTTVPVSVASLPAGDGAARREAAPDLAARGPETVAAGAGSWRRPGGAESAESAPSVAAVRSPGQDAGRRPGAAERSADSPTELRRRWGRPAS